MLMDLWHVFTQVLSFNKYPAASNLRSLEDDYFLIFLNQIITFSLFMACRSVPLVPNRKA